MRRVLLLAIVFGAFSASACGVFATQASHEAQAAKTASLEKSVEQARADTASLRADLEATRARLDNALRANADMALSLLKMFDQPHSPVE